MTQSATSTGGGVGGALTRFWNFLKVFCVAMKWNVVELCTRHRKLNLQVTPKRHGEYAVITGGNRGIGAEVVKQLLTLDLNVIIACRNESSGNDLIDKLRKEGITTGNAESLQLDLSSLESVRNFAQTLLDRNIPISILINNAGIMFPPYEITKDGFESQLQTNYLSHFLLTNLLLPLLEIGGDHYRMSRVINVSSVANFGGDIDFDDLNYQRRGYDKHMAYMSAKLMQVVSAKDLNARFKADGKPVRVFSLHPGVIYTDLYTNMWYLSPLSCIIKKLFKSTAQGADGIVYVAASPEVETDGGEYFMNCRKHLPNRKARDPSIQQKLWSTSMSLTGLKTSYKKGNVEIVTIT